MVMLLPQVGHCPSCAAMPSLASRRDEQYPQLNPKRFPPEMGRPNVPMFGGGGREGWYCCWRCVATPPPPPPPPAPAPTSSRSGEAAAAGTRSVLRHVGQRTSCPTCDSSAESDVRHTLHGNTSIVPLMVNSRVIIRKEGTDYKFRPRFYPRTRVFPGTDGKSPVRFTQFA